MEDTQGNPVVEQPEQAASNNVDEVSKKIDNLTAIVQNLQTKQDVLAQAAKQTKTVSMGTQAPVVEKTDLQYFEEYVNYCMDDPTSLIGKTDLELDFNHILGLEAAMKLKWNQSMEEIYNSFKDDKRWKNTLKSLKSKTA